MSKSTITMTGVGGVWKPPFDALYGVVGETSLL